MDGIAETIEQYFVVTVEPILTWALGVQRHAAGGKTTILPVDHNVMEFNYTYTDSTDGMQSPNFKKLLAVQEKRRNAKGVNGALKH